MNYPSLLESDGFPDKHWYLPGSWQEIFLVAAAIRTGIWDVLADGRGMTAEAVARTLDLDQRATFMVLEAMASAGYLDSSDGNYRPSGRAREKLGTRSSPGRLGFTVLHLDRLAQRWAGLPEVIKTGEPLPGDRFTETIEGFVEAMDAYASVTAEQAAALCLERCPNAERVLDVGAATGTVSKIFAERGLMVTLFDIPGVIELNRKKSLHPNIELQAGDFNQSLPPGPFDIVFMGNVVHIYSADHNKALFSRAARSLNGGGLLAILDYVRGLSPSAPFFGINMLVNTSAGDAWTEEQYRSWIDAAGLSEIQIDQMDARDQQLITARNRVEGD